MTCEWTWEKVLFLVFDFHYGQIFCPFQKRKYFTNFGFRSHYDYEKQKQIEALKKKEAEERCKSKALQAVPQGLFMYTLLKQLNLLK